ncbi:hypothetical protein RchiOBHm_Chr7g0206271 [Rosa chinensis]|uniref:Uncharacterized protein n=1 Tax=Rosa chinensis TaxID=74649 RepID=A0A2P6P956_ROSCH|nr:hypothetical protein RchiOBHm_Chr7g0206271 [Rosa chinensis]
MHIYSMYNQKPPLSTILAKSSHYSLFHYLKDIHITLTFFFPLTFITPSTSYLSLKQYFWRM